MNIEISFQTQGVPAPFAFAVVMRLSLERQAVLMDFDLQYLDRDDLTDEEIIAEGYTLDDDFEWKGEIGENWIEPLQTLLQSDFQVDPLEEHYLHLQQDGKDLGFPSSGNEVVVQELMQAALEGGKREEPLTLSYRSKSDSGTVVWEFQHRKVYLNDSHLPWDKALELMKIAYQVDYEEMKAKKKAFVESISLDAVHWYPMTNKAFWVGIASASSFG